MKPIIGNLFSAAGAATLVLTLSACGGAEKIELVNISQAGELVDENLEVVGANPNSDAVYKDDIAIEITVRENMRNIVNAQGFPSVYYEIVSCDEIGEVFYFEPIYYINGYNNSELLAIIPQNLQSASEAYRATIRETNTTIPAQICLRLAGGTMSGRVLSSNALPVSDIFHEMGVRVRALPE